MDRPDGFTATVPGDGNPRERARLHSRRQHQHRAAALQDNRVGDWQRMGFKRSLPLILANDDKVSVASFLADAAKLSLDVSPSSGEAVQAFVTRIYASPPAIIARAKEALRLD